MSSKPWVNYTENGYDPDDLLEGGRWMWDDLRHIRVYVPNEVDQAAAVARKKAKRIVEELARPLTVCPVCRAKINESCKTRNGVQRANHTKRLVSRRCPCGDSAKKGGLYCGPCSDVSKRRAWREYKQRVRADEGEVA